MAPRPCDISARKRGFRDTRRRPSGKGIAPEVAVPASRYRWPSTECPNRTTPAQILSFPSPPSQYRGRREDVKPLSLGNLKRMVASRTLSGIARVRNAKRRHHQRGNRRKRSEKKERSREKLVMSQRRKRRPRAEARVIKRVTTKTQILVLVEAVVGATLASEEPVDAREGEERGAAAAVAAAGGGTSLRVARPRRPAPNPRRSPFSRTARAARSPRASPSAGSAAGPPRNATRTCQTYSAAFTISED